MMRSTTPLPVSGRVHFGRIFELAVLGGVLHHHHHALDAGDQVHRAAHALDHLAGDHPVGEVAVLGTSIAPRIARSIWPPRIIAKRSGRPK